MADPRIKNTPPPEVRGRFKVAFPFNASIKEGEIYQCIAIRQFTDIEVLGGNVFELYYTPFELSNQIYGEDKRMGASIITLASVTGECFYIPDTFILEFPNMGDVIYQRVILSIDLGPIPSTLDTTFLKQQLASVTTDVVGLTEDREPLVYEAVAPTRGAISPADHEILEAVRIASIANRTTDRAKRIELELQVTALTARTAFLEQFIRDNGLAEN